MRRFSTLELVRKLAALTVIICSSVVEFLHVIELFCAVDSAAPVKLSIFLLMYRPYTDEIGHLQILEGDLKDLWTENNDPVAARRYWMSESHELQTIAARQLFRVN